MASGLEMLYNAIGSGGKTLSGHLRETELLRLQAEADARAQEERDALLAEYQQGASDLDRQANEYVRAAQELGIQTPAPGTIDDQIFRATGGFARSPSLSMPGMRSTPRGGTQLPTSSPRTEWAPSAAEAAISADAINASKDILTGRSAINTDRYRKRLEALSGLAMKAASRPSTSGMVGAIDKMSSASSDFMTREGAIADEGRKLQGTLAGRFLDYRSQAARDRQSDELREKMANQRAREQNASSERINKRNNESKDKDRARLEAKEYRLQQEALLKAGKFGLAQKAGMLSAFKALEAGDITTKQFMDMNPEATTDTSWTGSVNVTGANMRGAQDYIDRVQALLPQYQDELARMAGEATPPPQNPAIQPIQPVRPSGLGGNMYPAPVVPTGSLPYLNKQGRKPLWGG